MKPQTMELGIDLKKRSEIHLARKIWHMTSVGGMAAIYAFSPLKVSLTILIVSWFLFVPIDILRLRYPQLNEVLTHLFHPIMRESERYRLAGTSYLLTGVAIVTLVFQREIVLLTLLFLAFADPIASYFGIRFGKDKLLGQKSLQGTLAAFFVCAVLSFVFFYTHGILMDRLLMVSLLSGLIGALAELIPIWKFDDNLTLPVLSSTFLWALFSLFGALN
jgi:diacylglycerol kinase (CTP)